MKFRYSKLQTQEKIDIINFLICMRRNSDIHPQFGLNSFRLNLMCTILRAAKYVQFIIYNWEGSREIKKMLSLMKCIYFFISCTPEPNAIRSSCPFWIQWKVPVL